MVDIKDKTAYRRFGIATEKGLGGCENSYLSLSKCTSRCTVPTRESSAEAANETGGFS